jgi:phage terminase large subunit
MATEIIDLGYRCRPQFAPFHKRKQRWSCIVAHRRAGKTVACIMDLVDAALRCKKPNPRFAYIAPHYVQAKDVAWTYLKLYTQPIPGAAHNESELRVDLPNGARIRLYGAENFDRLRGLYLDGCILDEAADMDPRAWTEVIRPALSDRKGWATFIGTPKGRNSFYEIMYGSATWPGAVQDPDWFSLTLKASETGIVDAAELADARKAMTPEAYEQEYECSFDAAILGAFYGKDIADAEREGRITDVPYDSVLPVNTVWDLGKTDAMSIFFWQFAPNGQVAVIDHYENHGFDLDHYAAELKSRGYKYDTHFLPHDARAGILGMKRTRLEQLMEMLRGDKFHIVVDHDVMDGIAAARLTLKRTWFDAYKCRFALEALRQYRAEFDEKAKVFKKTPKHDWSSHTADAWRYLAMAWREMRAEPPKVPKTNRVYMADEHGVIKSNFTITDEIRRRERAAKRR